MARRVQRVQVHLQPAKGDLVPTPVETDHILRAADEGIASFGRAMIAKILKGSKDKKLLELELQECPSYGALKEFTLEQITQKIDWVIAKGYLEIQYSGRLPTIVFSDWGFEQYIPVYAKEIYVLILDTVPEPDRWPETIARLGHTNRKVIFRVLDEMAQTKNIGVIRFLETWQEQEVKKVKARINTTVTAIRRG